MAESLLSSRRLPSVKRIVFLWCCIFILLQPPCRSDASPFDVVASFGVKTSYNDNIFFDEKGAEDDYLMVLTPALAVNCRTERTQAQVSGRLNASRYAQTTELNTTDQIYSALVSHQVGSRWRIGLDGGYLVDSRKARDLEESGLISDTGDLRRLNAGLSLGCELTERLHLEAQYAIVKEDYEDPEEFDLESHNVSLTLSRTLSLRSTGLLQLNAGRYLYSRARENETQWPWAVYTGHFEEDRTIDSYALVAGWRYACSETWNLDATVGGRYSLSKETQRLRNTAENASGVLLLSFSADTTETDSRSALGRLALTYTAEKTNLQFEAGYDFFPASGSTGATNRTNASLSVDRRLGEKWAAGVNFRYYLNQTDNELNSGAASRTDTQAFQVNPYLRYRIMRNLVADLQYLGTWIQDHEDKSEKRQNVVSLMVRWDVSFFN